MTENIQVLKDNIKVLLKLVSDINLEVDGDYNLLWVICRKYEAELFKKLVQKGFDIDIKNKYGNTVLIEASQIGNLKIVELLLKNNADPNIKDSYGDTALIEASAGGFFEIVKLLLENNADINIKNTYNNTALIYASRYGHLKIVKLLKKYGANE